VILVGMMGVFREWLRIFERGILVFFRVLR
jgi:hypothetical protein